MSLPLELVKEIDVLNMYSMQSHMEGLKIHDSANQETIDAAKRLFEKGLIDQPDGGYLTHAGVEAVDHVHHLITLLKQGH